jgi:hypothetical protein
METLLQDDILAIVLLTFEENTNQKKKAFKTVFVEFDQILSKATRKVLEDTISFIDFIDGLYSEDDCMVKGILKELRNQVSKELDYKIEDAEMFINVPVESIETGTVEENEEESEEELTEEESEDYSLSV